MKIHEYNQMMNYLTRKSPPERTGLAKGTTSDTKVTPKKAKILEYIDDNIAMYEPETATPEQLEGLEKRLANARAHVTPPKKKVKVAAKPNGEYKMPASNLDSFDWDLWLREKDPNYQTLEEEKKAGILEFELSQEYWLEQYDNYLNQGGMLSFKEFMQQQMNNKVSRAIDKRVKEKMKTEGIAQILSLPLDKI